MVKRTLYIRDILGFVGVRNGSVEKQAIFIAYKFL